MCPILLFPISFQSSDQVKLDFWGFIIRIPLIVKSQGAKKWTFLPRDQWLSNLEIWNSGYCWLRICRNLEFHFVRYEVLDERRWWFTRRSPLKFIQIHLSEGAKLMKMFSSLTLLRLGGGAQSVPLRFLPYRAKTVCSRLMKLSDF